MIKNVDAQKFEFHILDVSKRFNIVILSDTDEPVYSMFFTGTEEQANLKAEQIKKTNISYQEHYLDRFLPVVW